MLWNTGKEAGFTVWGIAGIIIDLDTEYVGEFLHTIFVCLRRLIVNTIEFPETPLLQEYGHLVTIDFPIVLISVLI